MFGRGHQGAPAGRLDVLRRLPIFAHYTDEELREIDALVCQTVVPRGGTLIRQGEPGREAFIVLAGEAEVRVDGEMVAVVRAGEVVGEMALLDNKPRSASVVAMTPLEILVIDPRQFAMLFSDARAARWIAASLARRLRDFETARQLVAAS
jgi:CRP/FNR family transcriptional regulator, cyclic AMP receptor protein